MIFGLKEKSFKVEDATFYTKELSRSEFFEYCDAKNASDRYPFAIERITKVENLFDVNGQPVTIEALRACNDPSYDFQIVFINAYGEEIVFGEINKTIAEKAKSAEKKEESPTA